MRAVILHGTSNNHKGNWFPWLKAELEKLGVQTWVPDLPESNRPNVKRYTNFLLSSDFDFSDSLIIGHSSGAVEVLDLLQNLPSGTKANTAIMVAVFKGDLGWEDLKDLADFSYDAIKVQHAAKQRIVIHSDDDPHCPIEGARQIAQDIDAQMIEMHGMKHFSHNTDPRFKKFPELLEIIKQKVLQ